jgi:hypothetical protein
VDELDVLRRRTPGDGERALLDHVARLARACAADASAELHFEGD